MSYLGLHAYLASEDLARERYPFYALIAEAIRRADTENLEKLRVAWPEIVDEFQRRYNAPGGILPGDEAAQ